MNIRIDGIGDDDLETFYTVLSTPFAFDLPDDEEERATRLAEMGSLAEPDRARCAFDGDEMVGTLGAFTLPMTIPGASTTAAGTTMVTVLPSHRRRGALRGMMSAHLADTRQRGEFMAALWASDSGIYHRFGFGMAAVNADIEIERYHVGLHRSLPPPGRVRMVSKDEFRRAATPLYADVASGRPGMFQRNEAWWNRRLRDRKSDRDGATAFRFALAEGDTGPEGYIMYRLKAGPWANDHGDGEIKVVELINATPTAAEALWAYALNHDLTAKITAHNIAEDDPLFSLLDAWRRAAPKITDNLWVRLVDVREALSTRRYTLDGALTMKIRDPFFDTLDTLMISVTDGSATVQRTTGDADLELDVEDLSAAYLGRPRFRQLARAGRLSGAGDALRTADLLFSWDPAPWCQEVF
jgi:predicted acetyltransferase